MTQAQRVEFLRKFYELTDGELNTHVKAREEVGEPLGFDQKTVDKIVQYWEDEGWIRWARMGYIEFTRPGRRAARDLFEQEAAGSEVPPGQPIGFRP